MQHECETVTCVSCLFESLSPGSGATLHVLFLMDGMSHRETTVMTKRPEEVSFTRFLLVFQI